MQEKLENLTFFMVVELPERNRATKKWDLGHDYQEKLFNFTVLEKSRNKLAPAQ